MVLKYPIPIFRVFLETEVFVNANFNYQENSFKKLIELVDDASLVLYQTTVTYKEVLSNIEQEVKISNSGFKALTKDFRRQAKIFYNIPNLKSLFSIKPNPDEICNLLKDQFEDYLEKTKAKIISIDKVSPEKVFDKYFSNLPPFKEGKNKNEFPDAFSIEALEKEARDNNFTIHVISNDNDWKNACSQSDNLVCIDNIEKFLEKQIIVATKYKDINLYYDFLENNFYQFEREISNRCDDLEFSLGDGYNFNFAELGSEEIDVKVESIELKDKTLIEIDDDTMTFELDVEISFLADVSYSSLEFAVYDKEDEQYYNVEPKVERVHQQIAMPVEVHLSYKRNNSDDLIFDQVIDISLDPHNLVNTIDIHPEYYDDY